MCVCVCVCDNKGQFSLSFSYTRYCAKNFSSLIFQNNNPHFTDAEKGAESLSYLLKVIQPASGRART